VYVKHTNSNGDDKSYGNMFYIRLLVVWWLLMPSDDTVLSVSGIKRFFVLCVNRELIHEKDMSW